MRRLAESAKAPSQLHRDSSDAVGEGPAPTLDGVGAVSSSAPTMRHVNKDASTYDFRLAFMQKACPKCGEIRALAIRCPACGSPPDPREVDPERSRRQRVIAPALAALTETPEPHPLAIENVYGELEQLAGGLLSALRSALIPGGTGQDLVRWATRVSQLRSDVHSAPKLRPWVGAWAAAEASSERLSFALGRFVEVGGANTIIEAQRAAREGQEALNDAASPISRQAKELALVQAVAAASTVEEALGIYGQQVFAKAQARDLLSLDREAVEHYRRITRSDGEPPAGTGLGLSLLVGHLESTHNMMRFWRVAETAFLRLTSRPDGFERLVARRDWHDDFKMSLLRLYDASVGLAGTLASARHARHEVDALLTAAHSLIEGTAKRLMAGLFIGTAGGKYEDARTWDATELIRRLHDVGLADLLEGVDHTIRVAEAHDEFHLEGDHVVFTGRSAQYPRLSVPELVDRVLAAEESIAALVAATYCACISVGGSAPDINPVDDLAIGTDGVLSLLAALNGMADAEILLEPPWLKIRGTVELSARSMPIVGSMLPYIPDSFDRLTLDGGAEHERHVLAGPLGNLRRAADAEGLDKALAYTQAWSEWTLDDHPVVSTVQVRKMSAVRAMQTMAGGDVRSAIATLRSIRRLAMDLGDDELAETMVQSMQWVRDASIGLLGDRSARLPGRLDEWATTAVPNPFP
jgi:hypothetical protein